MERTEHFPYNYDTFTDPFIHLLGSSLIKWMISIINGKGKIKQDFEVRLGEAMLLPRQRGSPRRIRQSEIQALGSPG